MATLRVRVVFARFFFAVLLAMPLAGFASEVIWISRCQACHGTPPTGARINGAGAPAAFFTHVFNGEAQMSFLNGVLSDADKVSIGAYLESVFDTTPAGQSVPYQVASGFNLAGKLLFDLRSGFDRLETVAPPSKGTVTHQGTGAFVVPSVLYTPNACQHGADTYSYRAVNSSNPAVVSGTRVVNVFIGPAPAPTIDSALELTADLNVAIAPYTITSSAFPCPSTTTFNATGLPPGLTRNGAVISGTPTAGGTFNVQISAANSTATDTRTLVITVRRANQAINFPAQASPRAFSPTPFAIAPLATSSSGLAPTYSASTPLVCSVSGTSVTMLRSGDCIIDAAQAGNTNYNAAVPVSRTVVITGTVPGAPTGVTAAPGPGQAQVSFTPPANTGGSVIATYTASCSASGQPTRTGTGSGSPVSVSALAGGVLYTCGVTATNATGTGASSATATVAPTAGTGAPSFTSAGTASFQLGVAGSFTVTATGNPAPTFTASGALPSGVTLAASGLLAGTPGAGSVASYPVTITATNGIAPDATQSFTLQVVRQSQAISFPTPASPQVMTLVPYALGATASSGLAVTLVSLTPTVCSTASGSAVLLSVGTCSIQASQAGDANYAAAAPVTRSFAINMGSQAIAFPAQTVASRDFGSFTISPAATASSGLPVVYSSTTPSVCTVSGTSVTQGTVAGTCTIAANQPGNASWLAAPQVTQSVTLVATLPGPPVVYRAEQLFGPRVILAFTHPNNGGSPILEYVATCVGPGAFNVKVRTGTTTTLTVTLSGSEDYQCRITARNALGTGPASEPVFASSRIQGGEYLYQNACASCHGATPKGAIFNSAAEPFVPFAAQLSPQVNVYVRNHKPAASLNPLANGLFENELGAIANWLYSLLPNLVLETPVATPRSIDLSSHLTLGTISFQDVQVDVAPESGTLSAFNGTRATYTPPPGFTGQVTLTYRGRNAPVALLGEPRKVTINVTSTARRLQVFKSGPGSGTVTAGPGGIDCGSVCSDYAAQGAAVKLTASAAPGFQLLRWEGAACGEGVQTATTCTVAMTSDRDVTAVFGTPKQDQSITFDFSVSTIAIGSGNVTMSYAASSGLPVTLTLGDPNACSIVGPGTVAPGRYFGRCEITATQPGDDTYNAAPPVTRSFMMTEGSQVITFPAQATSPRVFSGAPANTFAVDPPATASSGLPVAYSSATPTTCTVSGSTVTMLATGVCTIAADQPGETYSYFAAPRVTANVVIVPPGYDLAADGDGDGIPNGIEVAESRNPFVKDNDVFASTRLFAMQQYRDFLGREGDAAGVDYYVALLDGGTVFRSQVIASFVASPEFQAGLPQVTRLYFAFFDRIPDAAGLAYHVAAYRSGVPLAAIAEGFAGSAEFAARFGATTNDTYIDLVYQNVLGRPADAGGFAYYKNLLDTNAITRGQMMVGFSESPEYTAMTDNEVFVVASYSGLLRRMPDAAGLDYYVNLLDSGTPRTSMLAGFLNSQEYHRRFLP